MALPLFDERLLAESLEGMLRLVTEPEDRNPYRLRRLDTFDRQMLAQPQFNLISFFCGGGARPWPWLRWLSVTSG